MKKTLAAAVMFCLLLSGCSKLHVPDSYTHIAPHEGIRTEQPQLDAVTVETYTELRRAVRSFVESGVTEGTILSYRYDGNLEEDIPQAVTEIAREDPLGAYKIEYATHDCSLIVSHYEIHISYRYRDTLSELDELPYANSEVIVRRLFYSALDSYADHLTLYTAFVGHPDYAQLAEEYCRARPMEMMAVPEIKVSEYPENSIACILELEFTYPYSADKMKEMKQMTAESFRAACVYVRHRPLEQERIRLLYTCLSGLFSYTEETSATPMYSVLCDGKADSAAMSELVQMVCDEVGIECSTVNGFYAGSSRQWNILCLDGGYFHVDMLRDLTENGELILRTDSEMDDYFWDMKQYPHCLGTEEPEDEQEEPLDGEDTQNSQTDPETNPDGETDPQTPQNDSAGQNTDAHAEP